MGAQPLNLTGLDLSQELLDVAERALSNGGTPIELVRADMRDIPYENRFRTILSLFTSFGYFEEDQDNQAVFAAVYRALEPGGVFLIDYLNSEYVSCNLVECDEKTLAVKVPAGVDNGDRIRLSGEGEAGENGGPPGDLYVDIRVRPHEIFQREGADLSCMVPVSITTAALGGTVEVPTLDGEVSLKVPAETQSGKVFRLRGKGVKPVRARAKGDLYCQIEVETPVNLTSDQKDLLKQFETWRDARLTPTGAGEEDD